MSLLSRFQKRLLNRSKNKVSPVKTAYQKTTSLVDRNPLRSFFIVLALLLAVIITGNFLRRPKIADQIVAPPAKEVQVYNIGTAPKITVQAQIEKSGIVKITAQTPGIVSSVNVEAGQEVSQGAPILTLSSNYSGSNPLSIARQLAGAQYKNLKDTFDSQKDLIAKQRELADKNKQNSEKLRDITDLSLGETRDLISLNDSIIANLQTQLQGQAPQSQAYIQTQQQISQFQSANNQIRQGLRNAEYQTNKDNQPTKILELQTDIAKRQLDLQEKSLDLAKLTSTLQLQLARVNEANYFPVSPFEGVVQRVHVQVGQTVKPGTVLATIAGSDRTATAQAFVPVNIARNISPIIPSVLHFAGETLDATPTYVSQEATEGQLYSIVFAIPQNLQPETTDKSYITIDIPLESAYSLKTDPFVPIDSVHQTQDEAFIYVVKNGKAQSRKVTLGTVQGDFIQVITGLQENDKVIVNRNILSGDRVKISL